MITGLKEQMEVVERDMTPRRIKGLHEWLEQPIVQENFHRVCRALRDGVNHWVRLWIDPLRCGYDYEDANGDSCELCKLSEPLGEAMSEVGARFAYDLDETDGCAACPLWAAGYGCSNDDSPWSTAYYGDDGGGFGEISALINRLANRAFSPLRGRCDWSNYNLFLTISYTGREAASQEMKQWREAALNMAATLAVVLRYTEAWALAQDQFVAG